MSQEIQVSGSASVQLAGGGGGNAAWQIVQDLSSGGFVAEEQSIATSATALSVGGVTAPKVVMIKNLDPTNFVQVDSANTFDKFPQKILPGGGVVLCPETATIYLKADTAACEVLVLVA